MVTIQIIVDGEQSVTIEKGGDIVPQLVGLIDNWKAQAEEPCAAGRKCTILQEWIRNIEEVINA